MIKQQYMGKIVKLFDIDGKVWHGKVALITSATESESGENELAIEFGGGLIEFRESEIEAIEEAKEESKK